MRLLLVCGVLFSLLSVSAIQSDESCARHFVAGATAGVACVPITHLVMGVLIYEAPRALEGLTKRASGPFACETHAYTLGFFATHLPLAYKWIRFIAR